MSTYQDVMKCKFFSLVPGRNRDKTLKIKKNN